MDKREIAKILKMARFKAGFSQFKVAESIGRTQQSVASWETGQTLPDANMLFQLFELYGLSVDEAFGFRKTDRPAQPNMKMSAHERALVAAYRNMPHMQRAVDKLLNLDSNA